MEPQTFHLLWQGFEIEIVYTPCRCSVIDHLEIRSVKPECAPLPITGTDYRSHVMQPGTIAAHSGDVVAQVKAWLDDEANKPEWQTQVQRARQGELF